MPGAPAFSGFYMVIVRVEGFLPLIHLNNNQTEFGIQFIKYHWYSGSWAFILQAHVE